MPAKTNGKGKDNMTVSQSIKTSSKHRHIEEHHVVLKEKTEGTMGTIIFKNHVRAIFPRSSKFTMASLVQLQNMCYHCSRPCHNRSEEMPADVIFWISQDKVKKHPDWALEPEDQREIRYWRKKDPSGSRLGDIPVVRASEHCIRHELANNGGRTLESRTKQKRSLPSSLEQSDSPMAMKRLKAIKTPTSLLLPPSNPMPFLSELQKVAAGAATTSSNQPLFQEASLLNLEKNLKKTCEKWVASSSDRIDRAGRQSLVTQFWADFDKEKQLRLTARLIENVLSADDYDRLRQSIHEGSLLHIANELGNAMVDWYGQHRAKSLSGQCPVPCSNSTNDEEGNVNISPPFYAAAGKDHQTDHQRNNDTPKGSFDDGMSRVGLPKAPLFSNNHFVSTFGVSPPDPCGIPTLPDDWWRASLDNRGPPNDANKRSDDTKLSKSDSGHDYSQHAAAVPGPARAREPQVIGFSSRKHAADNVAGKWPVKDPTEASKQAIHLNNQAVTQIASGHTEALSCFQQALDLLPDGCPQDNTWSFQMPGHQEVAKEGAWAGNTPTLPQKAQSCLKLTLPILESSMFYICHEAILLDEQSAALDNMPHLKALIWFNQAISFHAEGYRLGSSQKLRQASDAYHQCVEYMEAAQTPCQCVILAAMNNHAELMTYQLGDQVKAEQLLDQVSRRVSQVQGAPRGGDQETAFSLGDIELREIEMNLYIARQFMGGTAAAA